MCPNTLGLIFVLDSDFWDDNISFNTMSRWCTEYFYCSFSIFEFCSRKNSFTQCCQTATSLKKLDCTLEKVLRLSSPLNFSWALACSCTTGTHHVIPSVDKVNHPMNESVTDQPIPTMHQWSPGWEHLSAPAAQQAFSSPKVQPTKGVLDSLCSLLWAGNFQAERQNVNISMDNYFAAHFFCKIIRHKDKAVSEKQKQ